MRRFDKKLNIERVNLLVEQRYLESKSNIIKESEYYSLEDVDRETDPSELRFKLITSYGYRPDALNQKYNSEMERLRDLKSIVKYEMKKRGYPEKNKDKNIDENRFLNPNRQYEELLNNQDINTFVNNFKQYRDKALANVDFEIKPAFSDVIVRFVNKTNPSTSGGFYDPLISGDRDNYESGQLMFKYNDTTCIFKGELQGDSIDYSYYKTIQTNYNKPRTREALQVAKTFEDMCKSFRFRLNKNEVPTMYYKK